MNEEKMVPDSELAAIVRDVQPEEGFEFHRVQEGYPDGVPRAVFIGPDDEPIGIQMSREAEPLRFLVGRLAADLAAARGGIELVYLANKGLGEEVATLRTENAKSAAALAHARDAAHGLYQATSRFLRSWDTNEPPLLIDRDIEALRAAIDPAEADASAREAARRDGLEKEIERLKAELADAIKAHEEADKRAERASRGLSEAEARGIARRILINERGTWEDMITKGLLEEPLSRGDIPPDVRKVNPPDPDRPTDAAPADLPEIQSPITDAAIDEAIEQAKAASAPAEDPPTQPPHRERCKPIAGPWRQFQEGTGYSVFDDRGQCLGSVFPDVGCGKGWVWFAARPFDANANSTASDEESAKNAVREVLATWCDVTALAIPEAP